MLSMQAVKSYSKTTFVTVNRKQLHTRYTHHLHIQKQPLLLLISTIKNCCFIFISIQKQPLLLLIEYELLFKNKSSIFKNNLCYC